MSGTSKLVKVILLGDSGVGKSSLMTRFVKDQFTQLLSTIGVTFLHRDVALDHKTYTMQIWDTSGQERFQSLRTQYYRGTDCCLLTFSVNDRNSFNHLTMWLEEFFHHRGIYNTSNFSIIVIGNKTDLEDRAVTTEEAQRWCDHHGGLPYFETSAKDSTNVEKAFLAAAYRFRELEAKIEEKRMPQNTVILTQATRATSSCCCLSWL